MIDIQTFFAETQSCSPLVLEWTAISTSGPHEMTDPRPLPAKTAAIPGLASEHGWIAEVYAYPGGMVKTHRRLFTLRVGLQQTTNIVYLSFVRGYPYEYAPMHTYI